MSATLRDIPAVNELLQEPVLVALTELHGQQVITDHTRQYLDELRAEIQLTPQTTTSLAKNDVASAIAERISRGEVARLRPVINATGILLHTGLGRAPLPAAAIEAIQQIVSGYASVEIDLESGKRSQRVDAVEAQLRRLTGAEAAAVANNNAGATLLALAALAADREVIVSRGQLVEIGGSFRMPDVMEASGARLKEVGTTNKTHLKDYRRAINESTGALMRVHTSNYRIVGFSKSVSLEELVELGREHGLPVIDDIGSGALHDYSQFGIDDEPLAAHSLAAGADVVLFSGDKLLGGPQCGILVGSREAIDKISQHPLMRALRVDKITLAALSATLKLYKDTSTALEHVPLLRLLATPLEVLENRAEEIASQLADVDQLEAAQPVADTSYLGGGSVPTREIDSWCVSLATTTISVDELAHKLRSGGVSVMGRVQQDRLLLDLRTVFPSQDAELVESIRSACS